MGCVQDFSFCFQSCFLAQNRVSKISGRWRALAGRFYGSLAADTFLSVGGWCWGQRPISAGSLTSNNAAADGTWCRAVLAQAEGLRAFRRALDKLKEELQSRTSISVGLKASGSECLELLVTSSGDLCLTILCCRVWKQELNKLKACPV